MLYISIRHCLALNECCFHVLLSIFQGFAVMSLFIVLVSITVFVIETLPYFGSVFVHASDSSRNITSEDLRREMDIFTDVTPNDVLLIIDNSCNLFFFIEFLIKLIASPNKKKFFKSPLVVTELLCLIPYYIGICIVMAHPEPIKIFTIIRILFATRVLRIFRIFVLMKHFLALKILIYTIRASTKELLLLLIVLLIGVVIFACIEYYMEILSNQPSEFIHIPYAFWWAVITMTTVGYGDVHPSTGLGYAIGGFCAISGVLVIALSVPVIVNNFTVYYTHAQSREKLKLRRKKFEQTEKWQRLKAGLKNKLKSGALSEMLNGIKKRNNAANVPKLPFVKLGQNSKVKPSDSDEDKAIPNTARDVVLEDISETINESSDIHDIHDKVPEVETHFTNGNIPNGECTNNNKSPIQKKQPRSRIFGGGFKAPRFLKSEKNGKLETNDKKGLTSSKSADPSR